MAQCCNLAMDPIILQSSKHLLQVFIMFSFCGTCDQNVIQKTDHMGHSLQNGVHGLWKHSWSGCNQNGSLV